jgi:hypothetical protein
LLFKKESKFKKKKEEMSDKTAAVLKQENAAKR